MRIKKGDQIKVLMGKDRGKTGRVIRVFSKTSQLIAEGLNLHKKHVKPKQSGGKGEMVSLPGPIAISKIAFICTRCSKPTRIGYEIGPDKDKIRICKKCRQAV